MEYRRPYTNAFGCREILLLRKLRVLLIITHCTRLASPKHKKEGGDDDGQRGQVVRDGVTDGRRRIKGRSARARRAGLWSLEPRRRVGVACHRGAGPAASARPNLFYYVQSTDSTVHDHPHPNGRAPLARDLPRNGSVREFLDWRSE